MIGLFKDLVNIAEYKELIEMLRSKMEFLGIIGPSGSQKVHLCAAVSMHIRKKVMFVTYNELQAKKFYDDFVSFLGEEAILLPARDIMMYDIEAKSYEEMFQRISIIDRIYRKDYTILITSIDALAQKMIPVELFKEGIVNLSVTSTVEISDLSKKLISTGYERVNMVEGKGQFSVRGGIIDIFPVGYEEPVRMELFGDEIDSIRSFDLLSQRSMEKFEFVRILPARDVIYPEQKRKDIIEKIEKDIERSGIEDNDLQKHYLERLKTEQYFSGIDRFLPYIIENPVQVTDYIDDKSVVVIDEVAKVKQRCQNIISEHIEVCTSLLLKKQILKRSFEMYFDFEEIYSNLKKLTLVLLGAISIDYIQNKLTKKIVFKSKPINMYNGHIKLLIGDLKYWKDIGSKVIILSGTKVKAQRLCETLEEEGILAAYSEDYDFDIKNGHVIVTHGSISEGFEYPDIKLVVVSDKEIFGEDKKLIKHPKVRKGRQIDLFTDLNLGDYVVHRAHGIGQYVGMEQLCVDNVTKDYLKIKYQSNDYLYVPTDQLNYIQKFIGSEGRNPKLNKLGGTEWVKSKNKVKESLRELAEELITLHAKREAIKGFSFAQDTIWQKQFEDMFPYEETDEQLKCIEEMKNDMESSRPMDRLLCGDVGYGKTEVAIRGVFKAVMDGKQVAYLVPTTILAQQQYNNFKERIKDFPVKIEMIGRFRTMAEQKRILKDLKLGLIDVLVGTHRLIQKDIRFKDLGLLVIDEEQRFGVTHKENLKTLKNNVDVLTLSATPIPRTLHMALTGIKDISTIEYPPKERYPVQTYVMEYNEGMVKDAILREIARGGQIFYLFNSIKGIRAKAYRLKELIPEVKIAVAHGQMNQNELENVMQKFISKEYNVLVCTTIIESGLDIPNVNTIIVEDGDKMGLSQLYQIKGRVGRSNKKAYAYITYNKDKVLSEIAEKRLKAIREFTEFGSGFKIAMRDLEIRGAGNLIGYEQHGHMESVGYDMYCKLLEEAIKEQKGEEIVDEEETSIDMNINAYIDDKYINLESQKIEMYKKIASIQSDRDIIDIKDELIDRYGDLPKEVNNLIQIGYLKELAKEAGFKAIKEKEKIVELHFKTTLKIDFTVISNLMDKNKNKLLFSASKEPYLSYKIEDIEKRNIIENIKILLHDIKKLQSQG